MNRVAALPDLWRAFFRRGAAPSSPSRLGRRRHLCLCGGVLFAGLGALFCAMGGIKLFMPAEIRDIQGKLHQDATEFQQQHPEAFHHYASGARTMRFVETGAAGARPLVIFIHGSPGDWAGWVEYLKDAELTARARLIAVDRPGFGGSGAGQAERSLAQQCRDIAPLLQRASPGQRVVLVGHSFGGPIVCRLAMDHPETVTDVIVLAGSIDPDLEETQWYQYPAEWWPLSRVLPTPLVMANREILALRSGLREMLPLWPKIHQRVTVIQGEKDTLVPPANADFAQRMLTNAQLQIVRLPGMNHFLPWKQFDLVKHHILAHLH